MDKRTALITALGSDVVRFQDLSSDFDDAAAAVLGLERIDLRCISLLLFGPPASPGELRQALQLPARASEQMLERLLLTGYVRRVPGPQGDRVELTAHAREWVETLWGPLGQEGAAVLSRQTTRELEVLARFMSTVLPIHEKHLTRLRALLQSPPASRRSNRLRGGLSPAALRRVQLFVEANLEHSIHLEDLAARAGLSTFHFAHAFKASMGVTPRAFVERQRIERAQALLRTSELPLAEIAVQVGLGSQSRFTTTFRRATGMTPALYRRGRR